MKKKWKRILAVLLSVALLFGVAMVAVQAATAKVYVPYIPRSSDVTYNQSGWKHGKLYFANGWRSDFKGSPTAKALNDWSLLLDKLNRQIMK